MRGRKPRRVSIAKSDISTLQQVARSRVLPWFQVQRARVILAVADGERVQTVALQMQCDPSTVWRICRRYEQGGIERLLSEAPREGRLPQISPSAESTSRSTRLPGAYCQGSAYYPLEQ
jgi:hypothetical protein